jgi:hypothetical protein
MALKSAFEDLRQTTLGKVEGLWGKLSYIVDRHSEEGIYQHWGFEQTYGSAAAQDTFAQVHQSLVGTILQTRVKLLREDLEQSSNAAGASPSSYVSKLMAGRYQLLPSGCPKMTELHLISVLKTLQILASRQQTGSQSSSQLPPPGQ